MREAGVGVPNVKVEGVEYACFSRSAYTRL